MPSIEITKEQAEALARGENVTLTPPKPNCHVVVHKNTGSVYLTRGSLNFAEWILLHKGSKAQYTSDYDFSKWDRSRQRENFNNDNYDSILVEHA